MNRTLIISILVVLTSFNVFSQSSSWTQLSPPNKPSARHSSMMSEIDNGEVILFGGYNGSFQNDTWIWNNTSGSWTLINPPSKPSVRSLASMAKINNNEILLFGGYNGVDHLNDTWIWNNTSGSWTLLEPNVKPSIRRSSAITYIEDDIVLLFGGKENFNDETWLWNNVSGSWTQVYPPQKPSGRLYSEIAIINTDDAILFGGNQNQGLIDDTWKWSNSSGSWTVLSPPSKPSVRRYHSIDNITSEFLMLFGGSTINDDKLNDTWVWNNNSSSWTELNLPQKPSARINHMTAKLNNNNVLLFGGDDGSSNNETWIFNYRNIPTQHSSTFTLKLNQITQLEFNIEPAEDIEADGYIILYKQGSSFTSLPVDNGNYSVGETIGDAKIGAIVTDANQMSAIVGNLTKETEYHFKLIPFNWDGENITSAIYYTGNTIPSLTVATVPTLGEWAMIAFVGLVASIGFWYTRR